MKINKKLTLAFLLISLIPVAAVAIISYFNAKSAITRQVLNHLNSVAAIQKKRAEAIIDQNLERLVLISSRTKLRLSLEAFNADPRKEYQEMMNRILDDAWASIADFREISVLNPDGETVASTDKAKIGARHPDEEFFIRGRAKNSVDNYLLHRDGSLTVCLTGPLYLEDKLLGVVAIEANADNILSLVLDHSGLGRTGETLLAKRDRDGDAFLFTPLRFGRNASQDSALFKGSPGAPINQALLKNEQTFTDAVNYRGEPVLAVSKYLENPDWGLVVKIDKEEAFAPITRLANLLGLTMCLLSIAVIIIALYIARSITGPIARLTRVAEKIGKGDLSRRAEVHSADEVGILSRAFNQMTDTLAQDIAERRRSEEELRKKSEEIENFVYVVSHDLKAPLISLQGFSSLLLKDLPEKLGEKSRGYLKRIKANAGRIEFLISDLLALSRLGRPVSPFKDTPSHRLIQRVLSSLKPRLEESGIEVFIEDNLPTIRCDEESIYQVFENLVANAIRFMGDTQEPKIEIGYEEREGFHRFHVRDNGIGIDSRYHRKIFEILHRLKEVDDDEGTGIGLVIVERIITDHGGEVWVESEKGKGATFYFTLPNPDRLAKSLNSCF
ncbi:MAG: ATP-binding protein [Pseudomonadota bacterium]